VKSASSGTLQEYRAAHPDGNVSLSAGRQRDAEQLHPRNKPKSSKQRVRQPADLQAPGSAGVERSANKERHESLFPAHHGF